MHTCGRALGRGPFSLSACPHEILTTESQGAGWQGQKVLQRRAHLGAHRTLPSHHCRDFPCGVLALLCLGLITSWGFSIPVSRNWAPACQDTNMTPSQPVYHVKASSGLSCTLCPQAFCDSDVTVYRLICSNWACCTCKSSTWEAEAGGHLPQAQNQFGLYSEFQASLSYSVEPRLKNKTVNNKMVALILSLGFPLLAQLSAASHTLE